MAGLEVMDGLSACPAMLRAVERSFNSVVGWRRITASQGESMPNDEFASISLTDPALYDDPWAYYAWLRDEHPVWFDANTNMYAISRHADVIEVSRNTEHFISGLGVRPVNAVPLSIVSMDDPEHTRQRRLLSRGFTPRQVRKMTEHVRELTNEVIDEVEGSGEIDFVGDLAMHVPLMVISELLGIDPSMRRTLYQWSDQMIGAEAAGPDDVEALMAGAEAFEGYTSHIAGLIEARRADPGEDLISILTAAYDAGELKYEEGHLQNYEGGETVSDLSSDELLMFCVLLMVAGNETTRNAIAGGMRAFSQNPDQRDLLIANPDLIDSAVEEIVRFTSPVMNFTRTVAKPITLHGVDLVEGDVVFMLYQSANRDDRVFDNPEEFRIDRNPNPHVAFGFGTHYCMASNLARMEIKVVFEELFRRLPDITLSDPHGPIDRSPSAFVAGIHSLPATFTPVG